jgi:hypothetical protein
MYGQQLQPGDVMKLNRCIILLATLAFVACGGSVRVGAHSTGSSTSDSTNSDGYDPASQMIENPGWQIAMAWEGNAELQVTMTLPNGETVTGEPGEEGGDCTYFDAHPYVRTQKSRLIQCLTLMPGLYRLDILNPSSSAVTVDIAVNADIDENLNVTGGFTTSRTIAAGDTGSYETNPNNFYNAK